MALTKDDLQAIGSVIDERVPAIIDERVPPIIEEQVRPLVKEEVGDAIQKQVRPLFEEQNKFIARGFADLKDVVKDTYVSRNEFEQVKTELQSEVDDLEKRLKTLERRLSAP